MAAAPEKSVASPGPSKLLCRNCGAVEQIRSDWQRCYMCYMVCETRNYRTYPAVCTTCCRKLH